MRKKNKIMMILLIFSGGSLYAQTTMLEIFNSTWGNSGAYTIEVFEAVPEDKFDEPSDNGGMSSKEHAFHIYQHITWITSKFIVEEKYPYKVVDAKDLTKEEAIKLLKEGIEYVKSKTGGLTPDELEEKHEFIPAGKELSKAQFLYLLLDHTAHHRAQVILNLRKWDITAPRYRGW
ncbi:MAG: DinB family protein [Candidatus Cyclobacteriaceae bacterium M2_1C_046]